MAENIPIEEKTTFDIAMEKMTTQTPGHADRFNERFEKLLNNDAYLKEKVDEVVSQTADFVSKTDLGNTSEKVFKLPLGLTSGDLLRVNTNGQIERLAKGIDGQGLVLENGLPSWGSAGTKIVSGRFVGDETNNRIINIGFTPKLVILTNVAESLFSISVSNNIGLGGKRGTNDGVVNIGSPWQYNRYIVSLIDIGFSVDSTYYTNKRGQSYSYLAIG